MASGRTAKIVNPSVARRTEQSWTWRYERLKVRGAALGYIARAVNVVVDHDHRAATACVRVRGHGHGVVEIERPVGAQRGGRPHGAGENHGARAPDDEMQE